MVELTLACCFDSFFSFFSFQPFPVWACLLKKKKKQTIIDRWRHAHERNMPTFTPPLVKEGEINKNDCIPIEEIGDHSVKRMENNSNRWTKIFFSVFKRVKWGSTLRSMAQHKLDELFVYSLLLDSMRDEPRKRKVKIGAEGKDEPTAHCCLAAAIFSAMPMTKGDRSSTVLCHLPLRRDFAFCNHCMILDESPFEAQ